MLKGGMLRFVDYVSTTWCHSIQQDFIHSSLADFHIAKQKSDQDYYESIMASKRYVTLFFLSLVAASGLTFFREFGSDGADLPNLVV